MSTIFNMNILQIEVILRISMYKGIDERNHLIIRLGVGVNVGGTRVVAAVKCLDHVWVILSKLK